MTAQTVQFRPVKTGRLDEIPPDLPTGEWEGVCSVKKAATSQDQFPMLILEWKATEALTDGNDDFVGKSVADFLVFFASGHKGEKMGKQKLKAICEAYEIPIPAVEELEDWEPLEPLIKALNGLKGKFYTRVKQQKDTGEKRTEVLYTAPKLLSGGVVRRNDDDDDEDEAPKKTLKKKTK